MALVIAAVFVDRLLSEETDDIPCDDVGPEQITPELPKWFDEEKYNRGRNFFWEYRFSLTISVIMGFIMDLSVPSIMAVIAGTNRSNTEYTAYRRYISTMMHMLTWVLGDLKPGSAAWESLKEVRKRHVRTNIAGKLKGFGKISQRNLAISHFGFYGLSMLKAEKFGIKVVNNDDWESYNHFWRVIGNMTGIDDRFNICRPTVQETRDVCQVVKQRVFTPCLEVIPEHYEHIARTTAKALLTAVPVIDADTIIYYCRHLLDVPGYIYTEGDRVSVKAHLVEQEDQNVLSNSDVRNNSLAPINRIHVDRGCNTFEAAPEYKQLSKLTKWKLSFVLFVFNVYTTALCRIFVNLLFSVSLVVLKYCPIQAFARYGVRNSYINPFMESPVDNTRPRSNSEFYTEKKYKMS